jgi:hypothetical protein
MASSLRDDLVDPLGASVASGCARQWARGVRPLPDRLAYRTDDEAQTGQRFYLLESQLLGEWHLIKKAGQEANRMIGLISGLPAPVDQEEEEQ